jgi:outer membrane autotransporter protein
MRLRKGVLAGAGLFLLVAPGAHAQAVDDCAFLDVVQRPDQVIEDRQEIPGCLRPIVNRAALIAISNLIHRIVAGELLGDGDTMAEPAGIVMADPQGNRSITVAPAADVVAPAPRPKWNVWADGKYSWIDGENDISDSDGPLINATAGIDYKITDRFVLGLMGLYENSSLKTSSSVGTDAEGEGVGAYLGLTLTSNIVFSALVTGTFFNNDYDLIFSKASTDSDRIQASAGFTGYYYPATSWRWSPSVTAAWSGEWLDSYNDSFGNDFAGQKVETALLSVGNQIGKTITFADGTSVEPWAGALVEYTVLNRTETDNAPTINYDETVDIRLQGGFNFNLAPNIQLALTGEVAGLLLDTSNTYAGEANLAIQF